MILNHGQIPNGPLRIRRNDVPGRHRRQHAALPRRQEEQGMGVDTCHVVPRVAKLRSVPILLEYCPVAYQAQNEPNIVWNGLGSCLGGHLQIITLYIAYCLSHACPRWGRHRGTQGGVVCSPRNRKLCGFCIILIAVSEIQIRRKIETSAAPHDY